MQINGNQQPVGAPQPGKLEPALAKRAAFGLALVGSLVLFFTGWAASTEINGAVIASGMVVVDTNDKKVQHPTGGVVSAINVKNGDKVTAGEILLTLDETQTRANLGIVVSQLIQNIGRKARLEAERDDAPEVRFPAGFIASSQDAADVAAGEKRLFEIRRTARLGQISQLKERIGQLRQEIKGLVAQHESKQVEVDLMKEELERVMQLRRRELVPTTRELSSRRDLTRLQGEWGALVAQMARTQGQISEIELQILGINQTTQSDATKELREIEARIAEFEERRIAAEDMLKRVQLRAPQTGVVHDLAVHTVGGVISPGEILMAIVPVEDQLAIEARIAPTDIDQVRTGQHAILRFPAFNQRTTPEIHGTVTRVGADLTKEPQNNTAFYVVRLNLDAEDRGKLKLVPGMPVEAFIATGARTALSYLLKPVSDQFNRAFRER
jgi:HlyD family secretion protein